MKVIPVQILILLISFTLTCAQEDVHGKWKPRAIIINGNPSEWNNPLRLYDSGTGLFFDIQNDSNTLFLCFQSKEEATQVKINKAGMMIGIKSKGKLKCDASISFPLSERKGTIAEDPQSMRLPEGIDQLKHGFVLQNAEFAAKGFVTQNGMIYVKDTSGIRVAINWDEKNVMTYELAIPLKELFGSAFLLNEIKKTLALKVEIYGYAIPSSKNPEESPAATGGGLGSGGGAMSGMGSGLGRAHNNDQHKESALDGKKMKQNFFLALKP